LEAANTTINSATWASSDSSVMSVTGDKNGATLTAKKEGAVKITVTANTTDGIIKDTIIGNTVTRISPFVASTANSTVTMMRGCTSDSLDRGTVSTGFKFTIHGKCGNYYYCEVPDNYQFNDNLGRFVYVLKSKLNIYATKVTVTSNSNSMTVGARYKLYSKIEPSIANMHQYVDWSSSNTNVATVDANGNITTHLPGTVTFTGKIHGTNIKDTKTLTATLPTTKVSYTSVHFKELYLKWNKVNAATGYYVYKYNSKKKTYTTLATIKSKNTITYKDTRVSDGGTYKYIVRPYVEYKGIKVRAANSNTLTLKTSKVVLAAKTNSKIHVKWSKIAGVSGYQVVIKSPKKKTISKTTSASYYKITGLKSSTYYYYYVRPYKKNYGKKTTYYSWSKVLKVGTYGKTNGYFADQIKYGITPWPGVAMTYAPASTSAMNNYTIKDVDTGKKFKSPIKYNYSTKNHTLYMHIYVKFSGPSMNQKFEYYAVKNKRYVKTGTSKYTYKQLAKQGFAKYWSINIKGNKYDFKSGINFRTKLIVHEVGNSGQVFIPVRIGGREEEAKTDGGYWYFVRGAITGKSYKIGSKNTSQALYNYNNHKWPVHMYLTTEYHTAVLNRGHNYYGYDLGIEDYRSTCGHELGHCLGLNDGYIADNIKRVDPTEEIGTLAKEAYIKEGGWTYSVKLKDGVRNIMVSSPRELAIKNDVEMALKAQGDAINNYDYSFQAYKTYIDGDYSYHKSKVILMPVKKNKKGK
jgi:uncharacterized protein YjdB